MKEDKTEEVAEAVVEPEAWIDIKIIRKVDHITKRKERLRKVKTIETTIKVNNKKEDQGKNKIRTLFTISTIQEQFPNWKKL